MSMTALDSLLAQVSDAELEDLFEESMTELSGRPFSGHAFVAPWARHSGAEIRKLLAARTERRQAVVDDEAALVVAR